MEQIFSEEYWKQPCPKVDCRKKCSCGLRYINIPAVVKDTPEKGMYCNAIVEYEADGSVYIFSAEGIPVKVKDGTNVA